MTTISTLEGADVDLLGRSFWQKTKSVVKKTGTAFDKGLKTIPLANIAYQQSKTSTYLATGQTGKAKTSFGKTLGLTMRQAPLIANVGLTVATGGVVPTDPRRFLPNANNSFKSYLPSAGGALKSFSPITPSISSLAPKSFGMSSLIKKAGSVTSNFKLPSVGTQPQRIAKMAVNAQENFSNAVTDAIAQNATGNTQEQTQEPAKSFNPMYLAIPAVIIGVALLGKRK